MRGGVLKYSIFFFLIVFFVSCSNDVIDKTAYEAQGGASGQSEQNEPLPEVAVSDDGFKYAVVNRSVAVYGLDDDNDRVNLKIPSYIQGLPVTEIADYAFREEKAIASIEFPETLQKIGKEAFYNCESLFKVVFPSKLKSIGTKAFAECESLTDVTLNQGLEVIDSAFQYSAVTAITIPSSIKSMKSAFFQCKSLKSVILKNGLTELSEEAFVATGISTIDFPDTLVSIGDWAFNGTNITSVTFPPHISHIGKGAFRGTKITSIEWPAGVASIEAYTFYGTPLEELTYAQGCVITSIGEKAFAWSDYPENTGSKFTSFTVPEGVKYLGSSVFDGSNIGNLVLPSTLETIDDRAFSHTKIEELRLPQNIKKIGNDIFGAYSYGSYTNLKKLVVACDLTEDSLMMNHIYEGIQNGGVYKGELGTYDTAFAIYLSREDDLGVELVFEDNVKKVSGEIIHGYFSSIDFGNNIEVSDFENGGFIENLVFNNPTQSFENCEFRARSLRFDADSVFNECKFSYAENIQINTDCTKMKDSEFYGYDEDEGPCELVIKNGVTLMPATFRNVCFSKFQIPDSVVKTNKYVNPNDWYACGFKDCIFDFDMTINENVDFEVWGFYRCQFNGILTLKAPVSCDYCNAKKLVLATSDGVPQNIGYINKTCWYDITVEDFELSSDVTRWHGGIKFTKPTALDFSNITYIDGKIDGAENITKVILGSNLTEIDCRGAFEGCGNAQFVFKGPLKLTENAKYCFKGCTKITQKPTLIGSEPDGAFSGTGIN